ncbi:hypothetical protein [Streptomyces yerevanensis]|uniref:hypothetical protein n=1 Tax=Streptomyces yerevanensis TaxID=66378 RepID=UPI0005251577|nr:hypothetical protein [Streptomyces yerevanensis]
MKRTALAASVLSVAVLTGLTGCGSDDSDTDAAAATAAEDKPKASATQAKGPNPAERLAKLMVTQAEIGGGYKVEKSSLDAEYAFAKSQDEVTLDKEVCAPLAYVMNQLPLGEPQAFLTHHASINTLTKGSNYITLNAYEEESKAQSAMAGLSKAVDSCGAGFTAKANGNSGKHDTVTAEKTDAAGDESLAFKSTLTLKGITHTVHGAAVRSADVVTVYYSVNGGAIFKGYPSDAKIPAAILKAQNAKLG